MVIRLVFLRVFRGFVQKAWSVAPTALFLIATDTQG